MWILLSRGVLFFLIFSFLGFGEDFEKICDEEVLKEDFNISVVKEDCFKTGLKYEKDEDFGNASGYYLIADKTYLNLEKFAQKIPKDASGIYSNIGHSYMIEGKYKKGEKYYKKFIESYHNPNPPMQNDFKELLKLYPKNKIALNKAQETWNRLYQPLHELDSIYTKLDFLEPSEEAITLLMEIINIKEKYLPRTLSITSDYQSLAIILEEKFSRYNQALTLYSKMINIYFELLGEEYFNTATAYYNIANILNLQGNYHQALYLYEKTLKIDLKLFGENHSETSSTYHNMANVYLNLQEFDKALELYQKSLDIYSTLFDKEHEYVTATYQEMANIFNLKGKYDTALNLYNEALKIDLKKFGLYHNYVAGLYHNIAYTYNNKGEYIKALEFYNQALEIDLKIFGEHHTSTATTLHAIAYVYHNLGNYDKALKIYKKVEAIDLDILGKFHPDTATTYHHIAYAYQEKKNYKEALKFYKIALEIKEKILGKHHISTASTYHNMANIYEDSQQLSKAFREYNKTLEIELEILGENHQNTANTYNNLGNLLNDMKKHSTALFYFQKALTINRNILRKNHPTISTNFHNIGTTYFYLKDYSQAYHNTLASFNIFLTNRIKTIKALDNFEKKSYLASNQDIMRLSHLFKTSYSFEPEKLQNKMLFYWLNYKGTLFEYQNILSMVRNNPKTPKEVIENIETLNQLNIQLTNSKKGEKPNIKEKIHTIEIKLSKKNDALKSILNLNEINSTQIAKHLQPHQLYIDFARGNDNYYIFTVDNQNSITFQQIDENHTKIINQTIKAYRENTKGMADAINRDFTKEKLEAYIKTSKQEAKAILSKLYKLLIKKYLENIIKDKNHLILSPDGILNYFPFEALYNKGRYFIENYTINYISSGKEFVRQTKLLPKHPKNEIILFANANFDAKVKEYTLGSLFGGTNKHKNVEKHFPNLGDIEIKVIKKHYKNPIIFKDKNATIKNLMNIESSKILHLSTHGIFEKNKTILNPMLKSFLIFAGGNQNFKKASISALQLSTLDLKDTELVVLSACQSGLGDIQSAEGVIGLPKALLQAGAKNVIMSLWTVSNLKTAILMDSFYDNISRGQNYNQALQNAKIDIIKEYPHPYYWSAFILSGL